MDFGDKFINMFNAIYTKQKAKVIMNGEVTKNFARHKAKLPNISTSVYSNIGSTN